LPLSRKDGSSVVEWEFYSVGTPYKRQLRILGVRDSEKGSKTRHLASHGKAMHRTLGVIRGALQVMSSNRSLVSSQTETLKIGACGKLLTKSIVVNLSNISA
jgi:hypothetical protein